MIKTISFGDTHGTTHWRKSADVKQLLLGTFEPDFDYYIFVGDYVDSFTVSNTQMLDNLKEIIEFKTKYPDNVILLWGNHDIQYLTSFQEHGCSGFRPEAYFDLHELFRNNRHLFQLAFQIDNYLWTHAGVHSGWYEYEFPYSSANIAQDLNTAFLEGVSSVFDVGMRRGGLKHVGAPLWADKQETYSKPILGYHQIVGHTRIDSIKTYHKDKDTSITYIDCMEGSNPKHYKLDIKKGS